MKRRVPPWVALIPLALGIAAYWLWWQREAEAFRQEVAAYVPGAQLAGFPYRIEARLESPRIERFGGGVRLSLAASRATVNRQPWRTGHVVVAAEEPVLSLRAAGIAGASLSVRGPGALASIRRPGDILERLSVHFDNAEVSLPFAGDFAASNFEMHLRETPTDARPTGPTGPVQAEARIAGTLTRGATSFGIELPVAATDDAPVTSVDGWRKGGTIEIKGGRLLTSAGDPVAGFDATLAVLPDGQVAVAGTIDTECPATVRALVTGGDAVTEYRSRKTRRMPIGGTAGALELGEPIGPSGGPARSQEPPCPALRR